MFVFLKQGKKLFFFLFIFFTIFKSSNEEGENCILDEKYSQTALTEEFCKGHSYKFDNRICFFNGGKCLNYTNISDETVGIKNSTYNYTLADKVKNNCGTSGFFEPSQESICTDLKLVDGHCCFLEYIDENDNDKNKNHYACIRTDKYEKEGKIPSDIDKFIKRKYKNIKINRIKCNSILLSYDFYLIFLFILFLI